MSTGPIVVKIGGSLARTSGPLQRVLSLLGSARRGIVVVPGGGEFADSVRGAQLRFGFDDGAAHRMAIVGMHQMGLMLASLVPGLRVCEDLQDIAAGLEAGKKLVWLPLRECDDDAALPQSWDVTSDAIAARLAERLGRLRVVFVKSRAGGEDRSAAALAAEGLIDAVAARIIETAELPFEAVAADEEGRLREIFGVSMQVDVPPGSC